MKKRSHYEPSQSCVEKDITGKIDGALLKVKSIGDTDHLAGGVTSRLNIELQKVVDHNNRIGLLAAPVSEDRSLLPCFDSIKNIEHLLLSPTQQAIRKIKEMEPVNQLALIAAPASQMYSLTSAFDSMKSSCQSAFSATQQEALKIKEMFGSVNQIGLLATDLCKYNSVLSGFDPIKNSSHLALSATQQEALKLKNLLEPVNQLALLAAPVGYDRTVLSRIDSIVDAATLAGGGAFKIARNVHQNEPIIRYDSFREKLVFRPVFALEHNRVTDAPKIERPLIVKKNCPEEEYNLNKKEMRVRLLEALNTSLETQSKIIQKTKEQLEFCKTEQLNQKQEQAIQAHERLLQWAETLERDDFLLLTEEELKRQLQENPEIIGYILQGLQSIKLRNNQLRNDPDFIEEQRRRVAYNHNSFDLDEETDHLLNYEVVRWLESVRIKNMNERNQLENIEKKKTVDNNKENGTSNNNTNSYYKIVSLDIVDILMESSEKVIARYTIEWEWLEEHGIIELEKKKNQFESLGLYNHKRIISGH